MTEVLSPPESPKIVDPNNVPVVFIDWFITGGEHEGVMNLALGTIEHSLKQSNEEMARVIVASRLRCTRDFATRLHRVLGDILSNTPPESDQHGPLKPPKNTIN